MTTHTFKLILAHVDSLTVEISDALFEAGVNGDDTLVGSRGGEVYVVYEREADNLGDAIGSAIKEVEKAGFKVARVQIEEAAAATP